MMDTVLLAGSFVDGLGGPPRHDVAIGIKDGLIQSISALDSLPVESKQTIDAGMHTVVPGFVDAHVHLSFAPCADHHTTRAVFEKRTNAALLLQAAANALDTLTVGVTTVRDCGDRDQITLELRDAQRSGVLVGPHILAAGMPITTTAGHLHWTGLLADDPTSARLAVRQLSQQGVDLIKVMASGGNMTAGSNPLAPQFGADELTLIVDEAHRLGLPVAAHALNTEAISHCLAAGVDTIEHCTWQNPDGSVSIDQALLSTQVSSAIPAVVTLAGIARLMLDPSSGTPEECQQAQGMSRTGTLAGDFSWVTEMLAAGAPVVIASDAGTRFTEFGDFAVSVRCAMDVLGLGLAEVIPLITRAPADAIGIGSECGSVEVGKRADLVVLDGLTDIGRQDFPAVQGVWQNGTQVIIRSESEGGRQTYGIVPPSALHR